MNNLYLASDVKSYLGPPKNTLLLILYSYVHMKYLQNINAPLSLYDIYFLRILFFLLFCSSDISKKKKRFYQKSQITNMSKF